MRKLLPKTVNNPNGFTLIKAGRLEQVQWRSSFERVKGFTLIELMVVISIIAILSVIGITIYTNIQKNARDARRKADIDSIASAMEANYGNPTAGQYTALSGSFFSSGVSPVDPVNSTTSTSCSGNACFYCVRQGSGAQTAGICAATAQAVAPGQPTGGSTNTNWMVCANLEGTNGIGNSTFYCRQNQQ